MPITIVSKTFKDLNNVTETFMFANAGDNTQAEFLLMERIQVVGSNTNNFTLNLYDDTILFSNGNWLKEGFKLGDSIYVKKYSSAGVLMATNQGTIIAFSGTTNQTLQLTNNTLQTAILPNLGNQEFLVISEATDYRAKELLIAINYVASGSQGNEYSLIDGEPTIFSFNIGSAPGFPYIPNNTVLVGTQIGNKSGTFNHVATLVFSNATPVSLGFEPGFGVVYKLVIQTVNSGPLLPSFFQFNNQLKLNVKIEYARDYGQPFNRNFFYFSDDAQTGWFNEPYNTGVGNSVLISSTGNVNYDSSSTLTCVINETLGSISNANIGVGACYISNDESYYKNNAYSESQSMMMRHTFLSLGSYSPSAVNSNNAGFIMNAQVSGTTSKTIVINIIPNAQFSTFFESMEEGNRLFYVWVKVGTINHLVYNGQMVSNPPPAGILTLEQSIFLDHSQNVTTSATTELGYEANKEDDLGFVGTFLLDKNTIYDNLSVRINAKNTISGSKFALMSANFNFNSTPMVNGVYMLPIQQSVISGLPSTSVKEIAILSLSPTYDTLTEYGVQIYFPFLLRWEYWLQQLNADNFFYPNLNKDWVQYGTAVDWTLELELELKLDGFGYSFTDDFIIKDYDSSANIDQVIDLELYPVGTIVTNVISSNIHKVIGTHTRLDGTPWVDPWGMITVESYESGPRYIISSVVNFDYDSSNPLSNLGGAILMNLSFPQPHICVMECLFDSDKININNGVKFTTKIKDC